ncbi:MAG: S1C family serine protease [bacterium]
MSLPLPKRRSLVLAVALLAAGSLSPAGEGPGVPDVRGIVQRRGKAVVKLETREYFLPGLLRRTGRLLNPFPLRSTIKDAASFAFFLPSALFPRLRRHVGSGVIIERGGHLLTNHHVVRHADAITVRLTDAQDVKRRFEGEIIGTDSFIDFALVKIEPGDAPVVTAPVGDSEALELGDWVVAVGQPLNLAGTVTVGVVSRLVRQLDAANIEDYVQIDAAVNPGNSGGPIFDARGQIVGIVTLGIFPANNIGFAVPTALITPALDDLKAHGRPRRGYLGITVQDITPYLAEEEGLDLHRGVLVTDVRIFSPAGRAGFHRGDIILAVGGEPVEKARDVQMRILHSEPGTVLPIVVRHRDERRTLRPELVERRKPFRIF